jgi:hypothetical protein
MECADVDTVSDFGAEQISHARTHFTGGFVRKGYRQNPLWHHIMVTNQIGDTVGKYAGFAAAWTC